MNTSNTLSPFCSFGCKCSKHYQDSATGGAYMQTTFYPAKIEGLVCPCNSGWGGIMPGPVCPYHANPAPVFPVRKFTPEDAWAQPWFQPGTQYWSGTMEFRFPLFPEHDEANAIAKSLTQDQVADIITALFEAVLPS